MRITVDRFVSDPDATISRVMIEDVFSCFGLEDEYRADKIPSETRIPAGIYKLGLRTIGGFNERYARRFSKIHAGMLEVLDVPGFTNILIHCGNTDEDTAGCLLVGAGALTIPGSMSLQASAVAYRAFYPKVVGAVEAGRATIQFQDNDH